MSELKKQNKVSIFPESYTDDPVVEAYSNNHVKQSLKWKNMKPDQKNKWPETSNQEVGWFAKPYNQVKPRLKHGVPQFWVSKWSAEYVGCFEQNPFHDSKGSKKLNFSIIDNQMYKDPPPIKKGPQ